MSSSRPSAPITTSSVGRPASMLPEELARIVRRADALDAPSPAVQVLGEPRLLRARRRDQRARVVVAVGQLGAQRRAPGPSFAAQLLNQRRGALRASARPRRSAAAAPARARHRSTRLTSCSALGAARAACRRLRRRPMDRRACVAGWSADNVLVGRNPRAASPHAALVAVRDEVRRVGRELLALGIERRA